MLNLYTDLLKRKYGETEDYKDRMTNGLKKLEEANVQIIKLQNTLNELKPQLVEQTHIVNKALLQVENDSVVAYEQEAVVKEETEKV